jgi:PAS domain S-box-containing protein
MALSAGARRPALALHLSFSVGWTGAVAVYLILSAATTASSNEQTGRASWIAMEIAGWLEQYRRIFEATSDGLFIADAASGTLLEANPAFCQMHGYTDMIGMEPLRFTKNGDEFLLNVTAAAMGEDDVRWRSEHVAQNGSAFDVETLCRRFAYRGQPAILGVVRDISDQVRMEQILEGRVAERTQELESLLGIAGAVASTLDLSELVRLVLVELKEVVDYNAASLILIEGEELVVHDLVVDDKGGNGEIPATGARFRIRDMTTKWRAIETHPSTLDYPCVQVAASQQFWDQIRDCRAVVIDDVLHSGGPIAANYREAMGDLLYSPAFNFLRTWMAVPLIVKGSVIGYIGMSNGEANYFTEKHAQLARAFADHASIAIENARLYEQAQALAAVEERQRLARDLHDSVAQAMYGIALGAKTARKYVRQDAEAIEPIDYVVSLAAAGLAEMRALIFDLHPGSLAEEGLVKAIGRQVGALQARHGVAVEWTCTEEPDVSTKVKEAATASCARPCTISSSTLKHRLSVYLWSPRHPVSSSLWRMTVWGSIPKPRPSAI